LSIATLMFTGAIINELYPLMGISDPISDAPVAGAISILVVILCVLAYLRDKDFSGTNTLHLNLRTIFPPTVLFLCLIPLLSILSALMMNYHHNNTLQLVFISVLALIPLAICFNKYIPKDLYPFAIFVIAISLLYHSSLVSEHLIEWADNTFEYWSSSSTLTNSEWDPTTYETYNGALSLTIWAPIYSVISGIELVWVYKLIYPLMYSLVPVGMYLMLQRQTRDNIAFLACFFFMSMFLFYDGMLGLHRQQFAELFVILTTFLIIDKTINTTGRSWLLIFFGFSLIVSHYALSYIYLFALIIGWMILFLFDIPSIQNRIYSIYARITGHRSDEPLPSVDPAGLGSKWGRTINLNYVILLYVFAIIWYTLVASSAAFDTLVDIGDELVSSFRAEFLDPSSTQGLDKVVSQPETALEYAYKALHLITLGLIVLGFFRVLVGSKSKYLNFSSGYIALSTAFLLMAIAGVIVPNFASQINTSRLYHICLLLLSPFCIIGGIAVSGWLRRMVGKSTIMKGKISLVPISLLLVAYLLFNSGFIHELADEPSLFSLDTTATVRSNFSQEEITSGEWVNDNLDTIDTLYTDGRDAFMFQMLMGSYPALRGDDEVVTDIGIDAFLFTGKELEVNGNVSLVDPEKGRLLLNDVELQDMSFRDTLFKMNKVYDTGDVALRYR
ncbi:MAG: DUF2206 domain-containing protein, partial [Planctomycetes bacterium]|nr:DUF2206 domain-containing protein [Planctomycetota bacterium]